MHRLSPLIGRKGTAVFWLSALLTVPLVGTPSAAAPAAVGRRFSPLDYGAAMNGVTNDRAALQRAIDAAAAAGGGTVVIPAGRSLLTGSIELRSHVTLRLEPGSRILASVNRADYHGRAFIHALDATDVAITGAGTIDGRGVQFMAREGKYIYVPKKWRPQLIVLEDCRHVLLRDITIRDSASWTVHLAGCDDVDVRGLTIRNNLKIPNCDGIDPDCSRNVRISDCDIESGDDCIVVKASRLNAHYGPCENVVVRGCLLTTQDCALKIGTETVNDIRNVVFADCVVRNCQRGIGIWLRDGGNVENVLVHDIVIHSQLFQPTWWGASEPIFVSARPRAPGRPIGVIRHLRFSGIIAHGEGGVFIQGSPESIPEDIVLDGVSEHITKTTSWPSRVDLRPPESLGVQKAVIAGFHLQDARDVTLQDCAVTWGPHPPASYGRALDIRRVPDLRVDGFRGSDAHATPDEEAVNAGS